MLGLWASPAASSTAPICALPKLGKVLDDGDNLRILPMVSYGAASNLDDLIYLRGVDLAVTQSDVFEYFRTERKTPNLQSRLNTSAASNAELHILQDRYSFARDLRGRRSTSGRREADQSTGTIVFQRLGVQVEQVLIDQQKSLQKLQSGEVAALVASSGSRSTSSPDPVDFGLHLSQSRSRRRSQTMTRWVSSRTRISVACFGRTKGRHHRGAGSSCRVQLAEG